MDDRMLHEYRREPDPEFARSLRERLRRHESSHARSARGTVRLLAGACAALVVVALFTVPSVRVSAQAFLDLFRVRRFAAVEFSESRMKALQSIEKGGGPLVFDRQGKVLDPGPPRSVPSREAASAQVGFAVGAPTYLPEGLAADSVFVSGDGAMRLSVSEAKLRSLLDHLDLKDVSVPSGLDGQWIQVRKPPVVFQRFTSSKRRVVLIQARSPEVSVPAGWNIEQLAEIGLRVLGLDAGEARRIASSTDWRTTLLVPVPTNASVFRQVQVHGQQGLLITTTDRSGDGRLRRVLMWSEGDRVFCLQGDLSDTNLAQMAESIS
jgi:hypothetical protein